MPPDKVTSPQRAIRAGGTRPGASLEPPDTVSTTPRGPTGVVPFVRALLHMTGPRIRLQAAALRARRRSPEDDIAWWDATLALDRVLRSSGRWHEATMAAQMASEAVLAAATRSGLTPSPDVTAVAQSAGEAARVLATGSRNTARATYLTQGWEDLLVPPTAAPPRPRPGSDGRRRAPRPTTSQPRTGRRT